MDPGAVRRSIRTFISILIISAFIPIGTAPAQPSAAGVGEDGVVRVLEQTMYTDAEGKRWLDGVVVNDSPSILKGVRLPVTVVSPFVPLTYEEETPAGEWTFYIEVDGYLMTPGEQSSFHALVPSEVPEGADVVVGDGGGWAADWQPFDLEVVSVSPGGIDEQPAPPTEPEAPQAEPEGGVTALTYEEPGVEWEPRVYTVVVKNVSAVPVGGIAVFGTERQGIDAENSELLDALTACVDDEPLPPGATKQLEVRGLARADEDTMTAVFATVYAEAREQTYISVDFSTVAPTYGEGATFTMRLTHADGTPVLGSRTLKLYWDDGEGEGYQKYATSTGIVTGAIRPLEKCFYTPVFWGDYRYATAIGTTVMVQPTTVVTTPKVAATTVSRGAAFSAGGFVKPDHAAGSREVKVQCYRYEDGKWVLRKTVSSTVSAYAGPYARYGARLSLPYRGKWRLRGYHPADSKTRADVSPYDYVAVK